MKKTIQIKCEGKTSLPLDVILEFQGNLKKMSASSLMKLKNNILKNGFIAPMFVWDDKGDYRLLDGHGRLKALIDLRQNDDYDIPLIPCDIIKAENEEEARTMLLSITSQYGEFDKETLQEWIDQIDDETSEFLRLVDKEIDIVRQPDVVEDDGGDIDGADALQEKWKVEKGQIWKLGKHRIGCGDSADKDFVLKVLDGTKPSCIFTDPPYGVSIAKKNEMLNTFQKSGRSLSAIESDDLSPEDLKIVLEKIFIVTREIAAEDCTFFTCAPQGGGLGMMMMMMMMKDAGLEARHVLIWVKNSPTFSMNRLDYDYQHEPILLSWCKKHKRPMKGEYRTSIWKIDKPKKCDLHPTMKPVELYLNAYLNNSEAGDVVYDPFSGSGTAIIAAEQTDRICRSIDIEPKFVAVAIERYKQLTSNEPELLK